MLPSNPKLNKFYTKRITSGNAFAMTIKNNLVKTFFNFNYFRYLIKENKKSLFGYKKIYFKMRLIMTKLIKKNNVFKGAKSKILINKILRLLKNIQLSKSFSLYILCEAKELLKDFMVYCCLKILSKPRYYNFIKD